MTTYLIEVSEEQRDELARLVAVDYGSTKKAFGALPVGVELQGDAEKLHQQIVNAYAKTGTPEASAVQARLLRLATEQHDNPRGVRWAIELGRAATTIGLVYDLEEPDA